jgi:ribonucleoside-diphosphate reductase alpha chain
MTFKWRTPLGETVFRSKYASTPLETWDDRSNTIINHVCGTADGTKNNLMIKEEQDELAKNVREQKFMPGGRYIYYAGRPARFFNNCYLLRLEEDTRESWVDLTANSMSCLMTGGGIGGDISIARPSGRRLSRTGGIASGPLPLMHAINGIGREVMQGGGRRSAIYMSMNHLHEDTDEFLTSKNWDDMIIEGAFTQEGKPFTMSDAKRHDFNFHAPLDMMNISLNYDDAWLRNPMSDVFQANVKQAVMTGEPGFSFNFGDKQNETLRNACTEVTSEDDSDVCNLGSVNLANIDTIDDFKDAVYLASKFLVCGLIRAELPYQKVELVRQKNSRLGLGLMGVHEWLLKRGYKYEVNNELKEWLQVYKEESERGANEHCDRLFLSRPKGYRAIAPTGSISILAGTTSGIEPVFAKAYIRRYIEEGSKWKAQYMVDATAQALIDLGINPDKIQTAYDLASSMKGLDKRMELQAETQEFVDHSISSTINITSGVDVMGMAKLIIKYTKDRYERGLAYLRGITIYPDGARGGQPLKEVSYEEAIKKRNVILEDNSEEQCLSGVCGI